MPQRGQYSAADVVAVDGKPLGRYSAADVAPDSSPAARPQVGPIAAGVQAQQQKPSLWQRLNTGLISGDTIMRAATGMTSDDVRDLRDNGYYDGESPLHARARSFFSGVGLDAADTLSSFTSPASLATMGLGAATKLPKALSALAKVLPTASKAAPVVNAASTGAKLALTGQGLAYGAKGAADVADAAQDGNWKTPEGAQKMLLGASQMAAAAPSLNATGKAVARAGRATVPNAFVTGETAFVKALNPTGKNAAPNLRRAYQTVQGELNAAKPQTLEDLHTFADQQRMATINDLNNRVVLHGQNVAIDPIEVAQAGQDALTTLMRVENTYKQTPSGVLNAQGQPIMTTTVEPSLRARAITDYTTKVAENLARNPRSLVEAEKLVQDINAEQKKFYKLSPDEQWKALHDSPELMAKFAIKEALQSQLDRVVGGYSDLNRKYGSYKEIQRAAQDRIDSLAKQQPSTQTARRAFESAGKGLGATLGMLLGHHYAGGNYGTEIGAVSGYLLGQTLANTKLGQISEPNAILRRTFQAPPTPAVLPGPTTAAVGPVAAGLEVQRERREKKATKKSSLPPVIRSAMQSRQQSSGASGMSSTSGNDPLGIR